jgi:uracil-DNA glycosylase family 4
MRLIQSGPRTAKIVAVGEAPGQKEDETGVPFSGASGEDLNRYLADVNINRDDVFVTNVVHERPPKNKFEAFLRPKPALCLIQGLIQLKKDITEIKPNLVLALGDVPLRFLTNKHSISKYRGSILESTLVKGQKVIATFHPASVFRVHENRALIKLDMPRIAEEAKFPEIILPEREIIVWGQADGSMLGYAQLIAEDMYNAEWLSVDIETDEDVKPVCIGFSDSPHRALVVPISAAGAEHVAKRLLCSPARKCGQNFGQFDLTVLENNGYEVKNFQWDIMYSHHSLLMEAATGGDEVKMLRGGKEGTKSPFGKGLGFQVSIYTKQPFYKDDGKVWKIRRVRPLTDEEQMAFYRYNGLDAACTHEIRSVHDVELDKFGVRHVFEHEMAVMWLVRKMSQRGVKIDLAVRKELKEKYEGEILNLQNFLDKSVGGMPNVKSSKQMCDLLYNKLGLPVQYRVVDHVKTDRPTADKNAILKLAASHPHPVLMSILEIRKRRDLIERYLNAFVDADGRLRCLFDPSGTRTGRLASRANIYGSGTNLQNIPPKLRRMFVADPGQVLFYVDLSQAEARVVAWLARCEALIELFKSGRDIHQENAIRFFGRYDEEKRIAVKRIVHGSNYGEGIDRIIAVAAADGVRLDRETVRKGQEAYFTLYPEIKEIWWADVREQLKYRVLTTPLGWKRQFFGRWDNVNFLNEAIAFVPQCTVGVIGEMGMLRADKVDGAEILLNEHDAIVGQCGEEDVSRVVPKVIEAMQIPIEIHGKPFTIPAEAKVGKNWGEAAEDNPEGLKKWTTSQGVSKL